MYAIIATGGKQYKVAEGDVIRVEKLGVEAGETVTFDNVLAVSNEGLKVGADVANASVTASVVENGKAKKLSFTNTKENWISQEKRSQTAVLQKLKSKRSTLNLVFA